MRGEPVFLISKGCDANGTLGPEAFFFFFVFPRPVPRACVKGLGLFDLEPSLRYFPGVAELRKKIYLLVMCRGEPRRISLPAGR